MGVSHLDVHHRQFILRLGFERLYQCRTFLYVHPTRRNPVALGRALLQRADGGWIAFWENASVVCVLPDCRATHYALQGSSPQHLAFIVLRLQRIAEESERATGPASRDRPIAEPEF